VFIAIIKCGFLNFFFSLVSPQISSVGKPIEEKMRRERKDDDDDDYKKCDDKTHVIIVEY
jgi:hypothetical protein